VAAAALAKAADVAVVIIGNHPYCDAGWEKCPIPSDGKEAVDRKSLTLEQEEIAKAVYAANPKTIVVLQASFPYTDQLDAGAYPCGVGDDPQQRGTGRWIG